MNYVKKMSKFYDDRVFFSAEAFQFSKFHEHEDKHDKPNINRSLTVTFRVKNS